MNATKKFLQGRDRETADTVTGKLIERMPDGTYLYEAIDSGARRFATPRGTDEFAIGSRVRIDKVSASRGTIGSQDTIVSSAPREQRGLSETTPAEDRVGIDRTAIISVDPDPLEIYAGGDPGTQVFTGIGFDSEPATYVSSYEGGPDPTVTDADAPVTSDTEATMTIAADADSALGEFDAVIRGARAKNVLRVRPPLPVAIHTLWALGYDNPDYNSHLFEVTTADMSQVAKTLIDSPPSWATTDLVIVGDYVVVKAGNLIAWYDRATGLLVGSSDAVQATTGQMTIAAFGDVILYGKYSTGKHLCGFDLSALTETTWDLTVVEAPAAKSINVVVDDSIAWVTNRDRLVKWNLATSSSLGSVAMDNVAEVAVDANNVYVIYAGGPGRSLAVIDKTSLGIVDEVTVASGASIPTRVGFTQLKAAGGYVYGSSKGSAASQVFRLDPSDMTLITAALTGDDVPAGLSVGDGSVYLAFANFTTDVGGVLRYDLALGSVTRHELAESFEMTRVLLD